MLIGDRDPSLPFVRFEPIAHHIAAAEPFRNAYVHASTNDLQFERFCFERWFLLESFIGANKYTRFVHADSDLMFFCAINEYFGRLGDAACGSGRIGAFSGHLLMVQDVRMLSDFCRFMLDMYLDPELFSRFYLIYLRHRATGAEGGLCDMSALTTFIETGRTSHYQLNQIVDATIFDQSIRDARLADRTEPFRMTNGRKELTMSDGAAWFTALDGRRIRALTVHFQGGAKAMMRQFMQSPPARIRGEYHLASMKESVVRKTNHAAVMRRHYISGVSKRARRLVFGRRPE
ncbi:MAG: hypothetical protein ABI556_05740 [Gemmatimonadales bacterium]